jgi:hypothetical protein
METQQECSQFWAKKLIQEGIAKGLPNVKSKQAELEYDQKCGMYDPKVLECIYLKADVDLKTSLYGNQGLLYFESDKTFKKESLDQARKLYDDKGCGKIIEQYRQSELGKVVDKFSFLDKARIEAESKYQTKQRIFFGGLVLIAGIVIITMFSKKK